MAVVALLGAGAAAAPDAEAQTRAYVANEFGHSVSVIDTASNTVVATVTVGSEPFAVAITPNGTRAYVANENGDSVSVIDTASNTVVATVPVGIEPLGVAITPNGTRAYVANHLGHSVSVIDTASNTVVATVGLGVPSAAVSVAITPDGTRAYVANEDGDLLSVIDTASNTVVATVGVGSDPVSVAITPNGTRAYVANLLAGSVSVIDIASNTISATVTVGNQPSGVAITPDGTRAYVTNFSANSVSVIDIASNTVAATVGVGSGPIGVAIRPDGTRVYVSDLSANSVSVIDTGSNTLVATVAVGNSPVGIAIARLPITMPPPPPPVGFTRGEIVHLVAGPITPSLGTPVEAQLGFLDMDGNPIGPTETVTINPGEIRSLDLNSTHFGNRLSQRIEVRPVITVLPNPAGTPLEQLSGSFQVLEEHTGFGTVLEPLLQPGASAPQLVPQILPEGQTMRFNAVAGVADSCTGQLSFADKNGNAIGPTMPLNLAPNTGTSLDLNANALGLAHGQRIDVQPVITLSAPATGAGPNSVCGTSVEVFDRVTGRTWTYQSSLASLLAVQ